METRPSVVCSWLPVWCYFLQFFLALNLLQLFWPPYSWNTPGTFLPQGLWTCCFLCLDCFSSRYVHGFFFVSFHGFFFVSFKLLLECQFLIKVFLALLISPSTYLNLAFFQEYKGCSGLQPYSEMTLQVSLTPWAAFSDLHLWCSIPLACLRPDLPDADRLLWWLALIPRPWFHWSDFQEPGICRGTVQTRTIPTEPFHLGKKMPVS